MHLSSKHVSSTFIFGMGWSFSTNKTPWNFGGQQYLSHTIHVWYIYLHLVDVYGFHVGKYTVRPMDASWVLMGFSDSPFQNNTMEHTYIRSPCTTHVAIAAAKGPSNFSFSSRFASNEAVSSLGVQSCISKQGKTIYIYNVGRVDQLLILGINSGHTLNDGNP